MEGQAIEDLALQWRQCRQLGFGVAGIDVAAAVEVVAAYGVDRTSAQQLMTYAAGGFLLGVKKLRDGEGEGS